MLYVDYNVYYNVDNNTIYSQNKNSNPVVASPSGLVGSGGRQTQGSILSPTAAWEIHLTS